MSEAQGQAHGGHDGGDELEGHETPIKTPKQLIWTVVAAFVVPVIVIILLVNAVTLRPKPGAGSDGMTEEAIARRLLPIGHVELRDATLAGAPKSGQEVYKLQCAACHDAGVAGAPKIGDDEAWRARIATGWETLLNSVLKGKGAMAAQGGGEHSDYEIARAVVHLVNASGGSLEEPAAPEAPAATN